MVADTAETRVKITLGKADEWNGLIQKPRSFRGRSLFLKAVGFYLLFQVATFLLLGWSVSLETRLGLSVPLETRKTTDVVLSTVLSVRDYLARVTGIIPAGCAVLNPNDATEVSAFETTDFPLLRGAGKGCSWRYISPDNVGPQILAILSPDVSFIQKATTFAFIIGLLLLKGLAVEREIHSYILRRSGREPVYAKGWMPLMPKQDYVLAPKSDVNAPFTHYIENLWIHEDVLTGFGLGNTPAHVTLRCAEVAAASGQVAATQTHLVSDTEKNLDDLIGRFWRVDYVVWLLPTIGFLGTIYGISIALLAAKGLFPTGGPPNPELFAANIGKVIDGLGLAFDTTAWALLLVAWLYWKQKRGEDEADQLNAQIYGMLSKDFIPYLVDRAVIAAPSPPLPPPRIPGHQTNVGRKGSPPAAKPAAE